MKKLISLDEFETLNSNAILKNNVSCKVFGGHTIQTNDWCQTMIDTCVEYCTDVQHVKSVDGEVVLDSTTTDGTDCLP